MTLPGADVRERVYFARANRGGVAVMLGRAIAGGFDLARAVVIVADQRDLVGKALAVAAAEHAGLDATDHAARVDARGETPTVILVVDADTAVAVLSETNPAVAAGLRRLPPFGCVRAVSVAAGGATLLHMEVSPADEADA
jgi:hypothetical protein